MANHKLQLFAVELIKKIQFLSCIGLALFIVAGPVPVEAADSAESDFLDFLADLSTFEADYHQEIKDASGRIIEKSKGRLFLKKGKLFRSEVKEPYEQEIVSDGERLWMIDHDLEQVNISYLDQKAGSLPLLFLTGDISAIKGSYEINQGRNIKLKQSLFELNALDAENVFKTIRIGVEGSKLSYIELDNNYEHLARLDFFRAKQNHKMNTDLFKAEAFKNSIEGYDLVDETLTDKQMK